MEKFIFILALIFTPCALLLTCLKIYFQSQYTGSVEETLDLLRNRKADYLGGLKTLLITFLIGTAYIIYYLTK